MSNTNIDTIDVSQFYGGQKGSNYIISEIFSNSNALINDLKLRENSPNPIGSLVMIGYPGVPGTDEYNNALKIDKNKGLKYTNLNSSVWLKKALSSADYSKELNKGALILADSNSLSDNIIWCYIW
jgi:hypothetical protein